MKRGEVWWANLPTPWGRRPVLLLSRDEAYEFLTWVIVAPLTSTIRNIPTAVTLTPRDDGVPQPCAVYLDNMQAVNKSWLDVPMISLHPDKMTAVERAIHFTLSLRE